LIFAIIDAQRAKQTLVSGYGTVCGSQPNHCMRASRNGDETVSGYLMSKRSSATFRYSAATTRSRRFANLGEMSHVRAAELDFSPALNHQR
jgi:hypothetical protein